jgi:hypothetical protein
VPAEEEIKWWREYHDRAHLRRRDFHRCAYLRIDPCVHEDVERWQQLDRWVLQTQLYE